MELNQILNTKLTWSYRCNQIRKKIQAHVQHHIALLHKIAPATTISINYWVNRYGPAAIFPGSRARAGNRRTTPARRRHGAPPPRASTTTLRGPRRPAPRRETPAARQGAWRARGGRRRRASIQARRARTATAAGRGLGQERPELCAAGEQGSARQRRRRRRCRGGCAPGEHPDGIHRQA